MDDIMHGMANMTNGVSNMSYVVAGQHDQIDKVTSHTHDLAETWVLRDPLNWAEIYFENMNFMFQKSRLWPHTDDTHPPKSQQVQVF